MREMNNSPTQESTLAVSLTVGQLRALMREEISAVAEQNGHREPKLLYNTEEAARILGVPKTWLGRAARQGLVPCVKLGHYVNFNPEDLRAFIGKLKKENT